jgi:protein-tyrosine-phosphatase
VTKVLFVCTANVCRSPMAAAIFNVLAEDRGLSFRAESAGTAAIEGRPMASNAVAALEEVGIYPEAHRARQASRTLIDGFELVLTMSLQHAAALRQLYQCPPPGIHTLPAYVFGTPYEMDIPDPYGHTMTTYRTSVRQLHTYVDRFLDRLEQERRLSVPFRVDRAALSDNEPP